MVEQRKRVPAYAAALIERRKNGLAPSNGLCIATGWDFGRAFAWRVVIAPGVDPERIDWSVAAGMDCLLLGKDQERLDSVARELLRLPLARLIGVTDHVTVYWPGKT